ncbi:hypothetical protein J2Z62_000465 [Mycoplasmoides fastidiosum]|uniref:DUF31 domain-containing protein n=1 Tax=Mycoplasmoides fastidiosum TaxID=92758 RepID=A0ABU0LZ98_9BACT|nr:DUF31 family protein [Mycoplasmoides fastidiosum]MDQ0514027.1 hypothetical protein [Mycoplasmoides fastidiosum]UUD37563.1 DUF31 family protein [Mycoplasmoides fastidiosum]
MFFFRFFRKLQLLLPVASIIGVNACSYLSGNNSPLFWRGYDNSADLLQFNPAYESTSYPILTYLQNSPNHTNNHRNPQEANFKIPEYTSEQTALFDFFRSRVISLQVFRQTNDTATTTLYSGTGTILAKVSDDPQDYHFYVATNLHVAQNFLSNNFSLISGARFHFNPYFNLANPPTPEQLFDQDKISFPAIQRRFLDFKNPTASNTIAWTATDLRVKNYKILDYRDDNAYFTRFSDNSETSQTRFDNGLGVKAGFAADLAILNLDFGNLFDRQFGTGHFTDNSLDWLRYKELFVRQVQNSDVLFDSVTDTGGYLLGYPAAIEANSGTDDAYGVGMVNIEIVHQRISEAIDDIRNNYFPPFLTRNYQNDEFFLFHKGQRYFYGPVSDYNIRQLNLQAGASGSIFVHFDPKEKQVSLNGIYWGVASSQIGQFQSGDITVTNSYGRITKFIEPDTYDLIGKDPENAGSHSFCNWIMNQKTNDAKLRLPTFC